MLHVFGFVFVAVFLGGVYRATARRWRYLAQSYAGDRGPVLANRHMRSVVLIGLGAFNSLKGIVTIGVHKDGVSFRVMPLFSLFHKPLFVPYRDISAWDTTWYINSPSSELHFRRAPDVKMVLPAEDVAWIKAHSGHTMVLQNTRPPQGQAGRRWHALIVGQAVLSIAVVVGVLTYYF